MQKNMENELETTVEGRMQRMPVRHLVAMS